MTLSLRATVLASLLCTPLLAQPSPVTVVLPPGQLTVGDQVQATVTLNVRAADLTGDPRFPAWGKTWGEAEIVEAKEPVKTVGQDGTVAWRQTLILAAFRPGKVALPPAEILVPRQDSTVKLTTPAGLALDVRSVIPPGEKEPEPKPAAPPRSLAWGERFWWTLAILALPCLLLAWLLWRRRAGKEAAAAPVLAPFEELATELDRLRSEPSAVALHTRLSLALRRYLARRLPFPALESTTSEIQRQLLVRHIPAPAARQTVEILRACDLVKFARLPVGEAQAQERLNAARRIAHEFEVHLAPREPENLEAAG